MSTAPLMNGSAAPRGSVVSLTDHAGGDWGEEEEEGPSIHDHLARQPGVSPSHRADENVCCLILEFSIDKIFLELIYSNLNVM